MKTIKHFLVLCAAVVLLATLLGGCGDKESSGLEFELNDDGESYSVVGVGSCTDKKIVIPVEYEGKPVTGIGKKAFSFLSGCHVDLKKVIIPDSVTSIGDRAFFGCDGLKSITIPDSVTSIGDAAFYDTAYYNDESNWTVGVLYISCALIDCKKERIGSVAIKRGTTCIADDAFDECSNLTSITIPDSVTSIGDTAFYECSNLTSITIPDSVTRISDTAFHKCSGLTSIMVAEGNTVYYASGNCIIETAGGILIAGCRNSTIPDGVISICNGAFYECSNLTSITISDSVTSIGDYAFCGCPDLKSITISDSVTSIGKEAFRDCFALKSITFTGTKAQWQAITKEECWIANVGYGTIHCTDGDIPAVTIS